MEGHHKGGKGGIGIMVGFSVAGLSCYKLTASWGTKNRINSKFTSLYAHTVG